MRKHCINEENILKVSPHLLYHGKRVWNVCPKINVSNSFPHRVFTLCCFLRCWWASLSSWVSSADRRRCLTRHPSKSEQSCLPPVGPWQTDLAPWCTRKCRGRYLLDFACRRWVLLDPDPGTGLAPSRKISLGWSQSEPGPWRSWMPWGSCFPAANTSCQTGRTPHSVRGNWCSQETG